MSDQQLVSGARLRSGPGAIGYFSMEIALEDTVPSFSGGLGVLAGDILRSAADLGVEMVGVTLLYRDGHFKQVIDAEGRQTEQPVAWSRDELLDRLAARVRVEVEGRQVVVGAWRRVLRGSGGFHVPVYFLDTDFPDNAPEDRQITDQLYGGDARHRLAQEVVLGLAGPALLEVLGHRVRCYHMNEGHAALLTLYLLERERAGRLDASEPVDLSRIRARCVFTTHTPVVAGHDMFTADLVAEVLGEERMTLIRDMGRLEAGLLDMTELGMFFSHYVNAVSLRHREIAQAMSPQVNVQSVTNGVHVGMWSAPSIQHLFDQRIPGWRVENALLRYASGIPLEDVRAAHEAAKAELLSTVAERTGRRLSPEVYTIGFARRATPYKQTTLLFSDLERLEQIAKAAGPLQIVCSGKAHPRDEPGKQLVERLVAMSSALHGAVEAVFLEDYGLDLARLLCAGSDVWLNTPMKPFEASGTSGMKAAVNGVPSLSVLDGWWLEGWVEGVTGWAIGGREEGGDDAAALYDKLGSVVVPLYYGSPEEYELVMRNAIAMNGSFFNTHRVVGEYLLNAYGASESVAADAL